MPAASKGSGIELLSVKQLSDLSAVSSNGDDPAPYQLIVGWIRSYLANAHPDLGRSGAVCPYSGQALRLDTVRIGISAADGHDVASIESDMNRCLREFDKIPCADSMKHFRTIIVGFPNIEDAAGLDALKQVQARLRFRILLKGLMIGRFYPSSNDPGLWNREFRPLRSPIPMLAIRHMVASDLPFAARHPLMFPSYFWKHVVKPNAKRLFPTLVKH